MKTIRSAINVKVLRTAVAIGFILPSAAVILGQNQSTPDDRGTIERRVREAKKLGKTSIKIDFPIVEHAETPPLDDALERTTLVLAKVLKSEVGHDDYHISLPGGSTGHLRNFTFSAAFMIVPFRKTYPQPCFRSDQTNL